MLGLTLSFFRCHGNHSKDDFTFREVRVKSITNVDQLPDILLVHMVT